jgi:hypothetical protein
MHLTRAICYRLFAAGHARPMLQLTLRTILLCCGACLVAAAVYVATPSGMPLAAAGTVTTYGFIVASTWAMVSMLFILLHLHQQTFMRRLHIMWYLPLTSKVIRRYYRLAYIPLGICIAAIVVPLQLRLSAHEPMQVLWLMATVLGAYMFHTAIRHKDHPLSQAAQWLSIFSALSTSAIAQQMLRSVDNSLLLFGAGSSIGIHIYLAAHLHRRPLRKNTLTEVGKRRHWHPHGTLMSSILARSMRTARTRAACWHIMLLLAGLHVYIYYRPDILPPQAITAIILLMAGTLSHEIRSLIRRQYPIETVYYGRLVQAIVACWLAAAAGTVIIAGCTVLLSVYLSAAPWSDTLRVLLSLLPIVYAASIVSASTVVPQSDDIVSQLGSLAMYSVLVWAGMQWVGGSLLVSASVCIGSLIISMTCEWCRWHKAITGRFI